MGTAVPEQRRRNILSLIPKPEGCKWSDDQWKAISETGDHILVAAAAGSGKTAVLVERIIRKIIDTEQGFSVDRLLVATFTKAAASEMRDRIREALDQELEKDPENVHLRRQLSLLGRASITTLHSFCLEVIRRYYQMIPLDPNFRIINENEAELLRQEILEEMFEEKYGLEGEGSDFIRLVDWFSGERTDDAMHLLVQRLYDFSRSHAWPDQWLRDTAGAFAVSDTSSLGQTAWVQSILQDARLALAGAEGLLKQAHSLAMVPGGPGAYVDNLIADLEMIHTLQDAMEHRSWEDLYDVFQGISFGKLKSVRKDETDPQLQERVKELREAVKKTAADLRGALFGRSAEAFLAELNEAAPLMRELAELVIEFGERYEMEKRKRGAVDFSDLEHYCLRILLHSDSTPEHPMPSDAAVEYREQFDEVLLDEYQDTNSVQETIVNLISRDQPGNRFMVGDVKQSIYRFRLAEPGLFLDKYRRYDSDGGNGIRIDLARNFRSRMEVVDAVNVIFRQIMNETVAEISYDERAELVYGASFPGSELQEESSKSNPYVPELILIDRASNGASAEEETRDGESDGDGLLQESEILEMETAQLEARAIAKKIRHMMGDTAAKPLLVYDKVLKEMRPVQFGDMVILLRSAYIWGPLIMEELKQLGIPADGEQARGYFQATEVEIMLSLLQIIDNPQQDIPLAGVLRSPIVGLSEEELAQIRLVQNGSFYDALIASVRLGNEEQDEAVKEWEQAESEAAVALEMPLPDRVECNTGILELPAVPVLDTDHGIPLKLKYKITDFVKQLQSWRDASRQESLGDLIWRVYRETGYLDWVCGLPGGAERQSNLKALYDRAVQFEQTTASRGLFRFLTFISRLRDRGGDLGGASSTEHRDNAVRIMTIHKSKGLEFPVVFLAGMSKTFNQQDLNASFLMHKELGFGPKFVDEEKRVSYPTLPNLAIRRRSQLELLAEEMRVLYVGLTRPKEKLFLIGTVKDLNKKVSSWAQVQEEPEYMLPDYLLARGRSYIDWVGPALIRHPGAAKLCEMMDLGSTVSPVLSSDPSEWKVSVLPAEELTLAALGGWEEEEESSPERKNRLQALMKRQPINVDPEESLLDQSEIGSRLNWQYPYESASRLAAKTSVTEMKKLLTLQDQPSGNWIEEDQLRRLITDSNRNSAFTLPLLRPKFMEQKTLTPTERGTVYHTLMQHIPLGQGKVTVETVQDTVQRLVERELLTLEQAEIIRPDEVGMFFTTEVGERLQSAEWTAREMPFSYGLTAEEAHSGLLSRQTGLYEKEPDLFEVSALSGETVLIQGVVDCLYRDEGRLILLDYKTDRVLEHRGGIDALAEQYRFQLKLYTRALEEILHEEISEKWLYFFDGGHAVRL
ncbi:helicase-exonuclease AddAB subunit AddA [Paenibacillus sp. KQZ6P-2]|uniref:ATP-dependent helicase/nuclease subunit A n=1 Tax=Paenibacillus mangrovi TaxID=2931978 RepID=A0A9X2B203_9BACL|nr:helicase-exonuclease AddAB subunit AddA [Paenibacillus mangrovi]MCJ8011430.1 helicase-exonuclease AddAB subunit AddA [Paenibacillus mangrovi]